MQHSIERDPIAVQPPRHALASDPTELIGRADWRLGQFHIDPNGRLGSGASASVWLATEKWRGDEFREVALKVFALERRDTELVDDQGTIGPGGRVVHEAQMLCRINHPNVVNFYTLIWEPRLNLLGLAMEYLRGESVSQRLNARAPLSPIEVVKIGGAVAAALTEIHRLGLVHRDVKPANIIAAGDTYKLIDFGIAASKKSAESTGVSVVEGIPILTADPGDSFASPINRLFGTIGYIDPEHFDKGQDPTHLSDIYSLGATLYEAATGLRPAASARGLDVDVLRGNAMPVPVTERGVAVPKALAALIGRMLHHDPTRRPPHARAVQAECDAIARFLESRGTRARGQDERGFMGPVAYGPEDEHVFFYRDNEIATALRLLGNGPLLLVQGRPGAGKTSFVCAGVMPQIVRGALGTFPARWHVCRLRAVHGVVDQIFSELKLARTDPNDLLRVLLDVAADTHVGYCFFLDDADGMRDLNVLDRAWLIDMIHLVADFPQSCFRLIMGTDVEAGLPDGLMASLAAQTLPLAAIPASAWSTVIDRTVAAYGYEFETAELRNNIVKAAEASSASVALTQFALQALWEQRDQARRLVTQEAWEMLGGISGAISHHANRTLEELKHAYGDGDAIARSVLVTLVAPDGTREQLTRQELTRACPNSEHVIDALIGARLLKDSGGYVRIAHQMLIDGWLALTEWVDARRGDSMFMRSLVGAAAHFEQSGHDSVLWGGEQLRRARALPRESMSAAVHTFVEESEIRHRQILLRKWALVVVALMVVLCLVELLKHRYLDDQQEVQENLSGLTIDQALKVVKRSFPNLSKADQKRVLMELAESAIDETPAEESPTAAPTGAVLAPPDSAIRPAPLAPGITLAKPHPTAIVQGKPALTPAAAQPSVAPVPKNASEEVGAFVAGCLESGDAHGVRYINLIGRRDGTVSWMRLDGSFSEVEQACVRSRIIGHRFQQLQGDVTLARVVLPAIR